MVDQLKDFYEYLISKRKLFIHLSGITFFRARLVTISKSLSWSTICSFTLLIETNCFDYEPFIARRDVKFIYLFSSSYYPTLFLSQNILPSNQFLNYESWITKKFSGSLIVLI